MASQSVIITNPNIFNHNSYVNPYQVDYNSSESSDSSAHYSTETNPVQMQNISSTYRSVLNESFDTISSEQRRQLQFQVSGEPYLSIVEQPKNQLRFRYKSEKGKHGGLKPIVELKNYHGNGDIYVRASLYTNEENPVLHVFELEAKNSENGIIQQKLSKENIARFPSLSVYTKKKDEILLILQNRIKIKYKEQRKKINDQDIKKGAQEEIKKLSLNCGRLCFEAFLGNNPICGKIFSDPFYDQKCTTAGDLKIIRLSSCSGKASGGDDIILLCDKIRKEDIEVHFYEQENGKTIWQENGEFNPSDVHHQVAIPFKTPQFRENVEKTVYICLYRKSDQKYGDAVEFRYIKDEQWNYDFSVRSSKRKKQNSVESMSDQPIAGTSSVSQDQEQLIPNTDSILKYQGLDLGSLLSPEFLEDFSFFNDSFSGIPENVNPEAVIGSVSLALSKTNIQNSSNVGKRCSANSSMLCNQIKDLKNWISNILKSRSAEDFANFLPVLMKIKDENNNTLIHLVMQEKHENLLLLIRLLEVAPKYLINQENKSHLTPLHIAISKGLWKHARVLLRFGANPNLKNQEGNNCVHLATKFNFPQCLCEVLAPIFCDKIKNIMPDINALNYKGLAPLHISVMNESEKCTELLVHAKANLNITDGKSGKTPLHIAHDLKSSKIIEYLISQPNINRRATDFRGFIPCSVISYAKAESPSTKPTECRIEMSSESNHSMEEDNDENNKEEVSLTIEELEEKLLVILNSEKLWRKLGIYLMEEKELDIIEELESAPAKSILKEFKKKYKENYWKVLKKILSSDATLRQKLHKQLPQLQL